MVMMMFVATTIVGIQIATPIHPDVFTAAREAGDAQCCAVSEHGASMSPMRHFAIRLLDVPNTMVRIRAEARARMNDDVVLSAR